MVFVTNEFRELCSTIVAEARSDNEWAQIESDDMFQTAHFVGGFDATERAFACTSPSKVRRGQFRPARCFWLSAGDAILLKSRPNRERRS